MSTTSSRSRLRRYFDLKRISAAAVIAAAVVAAMPAVAFADHGISTTATVNMRSGPSTSYAIIGSVPSGVSPTYLCWTEGQSINGVNVWFKVTYGATGFISSYYDNSSYTTNSQITSKYGIPNCSTQTSTPTASDTRIWVGAPFRGTWVPINSDCAGAQFPSSCSRPAVHHWLNSAAAPSGDWAVDLGAPSGTAAILYAAPQSSSLAVTAKVDRIRAACSSGVVADGGYAVTVGLYSGSTRIGSATYAHIQPAAGLAEGQTVNRWGANLGTVGSYRYRLASGAVNGCWQGAHLHFQLYSSTNYACYNRGWADKQAIAPSNFLGFTGGQVATGPRQACA
ncbi:MAG: SH3 domain-containing protein [Propionibacteriales bacterium]|nr:SH3 domain-containing protein [Propionibacteriales bacterium]